MQNPRPHHDIYHSVESGLLEEQSEDFLAAVIKTQLVESTSRGVTFSGIKASGLDVPRTCRLELVRVMKLDMDESPCDSQKGRYESRASLMGDIGDNFVLEIDFKESGDICYRVGSPGQGLREGARKMSYSYECHTQASLVDLLIKQVEEVVGMISARVKRGIGSQRGGISSYGQAGRGTFIMFSLPVTVLIDPGSNHSYICYDLVKEQSIIIKKHQIGLRVSSPFGLDFLVERSIVDALLKFKSVPIWLFYVSSAIQFLEHFGKYGEITDSVIIKDRKTGQPRGFGFVTYVEPSVVDKVIEDTHVINGNQVDIKRTIPKEASGSKDFKTRKIFVGGIPSTISEDEFKDYFTQYGEVRLKSCGIMPPIVPVVLGSSLLKWNKQLMISWRRETRLTLSELKFGNTAYLHISVAFIQMYKDLSQGSRYRKDDIEERYDHYEFLFVVVFIDDIMVNLRSEDEHDQNLLAAYGIRVDSQKVQSVLSGSSPRAIRDDARWKLVVYASHYLKHHEQDYPTYDLKPTVVIFTLKICRHYLLRKKRNIFTDHKSLRCVESKVNVRTESFVGPPQYIQIWRGHLCVPDVEQLHRKILHEYQCSPLFVHPGSNKMYQELRPLVTMDFMTGLSMTRRKHDAITVFHPQTDGQSESVIQILKDMLRCVVMDLEGVPMEEGALFGCKEKLTSRFIGPYELLERIRSVAYRLALPSEFDHIHNVFHVSMLRRYCFDPSYVLSLEQAKLSPYISYEEELIKLLARKVKELRNKKIQLVKAL
ncbi:hypothetical protein F3Y22_tig00004035pilonHSYRG00026 [Hibiscus syriacus]|uniref:RRM domain-containing protein n=1 Tax=Hibiscus syriacus TaxID=106335 RepID=A0A6A3CII5_HIBSY|nr:hypothetical protein F3Y22_tig00004035pilonHSYRG00026 [Hibiscus syriacus]